MMLAEELKRIKKALQHEENSTSSLATLTDKEVKLVHEIKRQTSKNNRNNLTRTASYLDFFNRNRAIEWSFLAHMVSRNAGWNMTDLQGSLLGNLLTEEQKQYFFSVLERANWLIFQDAYPQLLLFEKSIQSGTNLFHLFPHFGVSRFMKVIWEQYVNYKNPRLLTIALIINEQSYIEKRIIQNKNNKATILETVEEKTQDLLELSHILFPYKPGYFIGQTVHHFSSLEERILLGKRLYHLLFDEEYFLSIYQLALEVPHTGSRHDFMPDMFYYDYQQKKHPSQYYSPLLENAWSTLEQKPAEMNDWYNDWKIIHYLKEAEHPIKADITDEYYHTLKKMELAIDVKNALIK
ncbi:DUF2515 family protein [Gracilibacillus sp. S3-1-1]|uniref:DUF2515 family protein n=1 Tax=Gracilibacillus pellucidus TaxID=3095368 RepID=A0ACC6M4M2_9BACI|nr:DUF2515 family protein [Gracilibacillus sp. S3-1-1]MDX8045913.1 DUF2515 family protein [Gracilibacillus sp. S3-1-1]